MGLLEEQLERIMRFENVLKSMCPEYADLLRVAAALMYQCETSDNDAKKWEEEFNSNALLRTLSTLPATLKSQGKLYNPDALTDALKERIARTDCMALETHAALTKALASANALKAANAKHSCSGGSRELADKIREIWASGKYSSRDICAEQECAALNMSFSSARKALRNTPDHA